MSNINLLFFNILSKFIWTLIDTRRSYRMRDATAAIAGSVVEATHQPGLFFINNTFSSTSKLLTPNMYCWSCKILVTMYWTYLRENGIWAKSFCPEKMNNRTLFLTGRFQRQRSHIYHWQMMSQWRHRNKTHSYYSELNYVQNLYFGFFIFWKLTELYRFVNYLSDDPRVSIFYDKPSKPNQTGLWLQCISKSVYTGLQVSTCTC